MKLADFKRYCERAERCELCECYIPDKKACMFGDKPKNWETQHIRDMTERIRRRYGEY